MIIRGKIENDTYKWNMSYLLMTKFPELEVEFEFKNRNKGEQFGQDFIEELRTELSNLQNLKMTPNEKKFIASQMYWIPDWYFEWYQGASIFGPDSVKYDIGLDENNELYIKATGKGYKVTFSETVILPIFTYLRNRYYGYNTMNESEAIDILENQIELSNKNRLYFSEFGLRRRYSGIWQDKVDDILKERAKYCTGNSNVYEAYRCGVGLSGTQAHEIYMIFNALYGYREGAWQCVEEWQKSFNGMSGILLPDTVGTDTFLKQLTTHHAKTCDGFRHDSGTWESFTTKVIKRLNELHVDPKTKTMIYSNSINMEDLYDITSNVTGRVGMVAGGIGGALTNNTGNKKANPNCVMKVKRVKFDKNSPWIDCVKCPDDDGKYMGEIEEVKRCLHYTGRKYEPKI